LGYGREKEKVSLGYERGTSPMVELISGTFTCGIVGGTALLGPKMREGKYNT